MENLFSENSIKLAPLAERLRPKNLDEFLGQEHLVGKFSYLRRAIGADKLGSCIFYGPPGTGKTTLANIIATQTNKIEVTAYAREADDKKGMDAAQVTGATSSYARKYALNGLFLLDDTKDVDSEEYQAQAKSGGKKATPAPTNDSMLPFDLGL